MNAFYSIAIASVIAFAVLPTPLQAQSAVTSAGDDEKTKQIRLTRNLAEAFQSSPKFELYSIDSRPFFKSKGTVHKGEIGNWPILGKIDITDAVVRLGLADVFVAAASMPGDYQVACFVPRHAIRIMHAGKNVDFIICFECGNVNVDGILPALPEVSRRGDWFGKFEVGDAPEAKFDLILKQAKITLSRDLEKR